MLLLMLVMQVATTKTDFEKQVLAAGAKQSKQADKVGKLTRRSDLPNLFQVYLLCFVPTTSALVLLKWMFYKLIFVEQSTFLRYLCDVLAPLGQIFSD